MGRERGAHRRKSFWRPLVTTFRCFPPASPSSAPANRGKGRKGMSPFSSTFSFCLSWQSPNSAAPHSSPSRSGSDRWRGSAPAAASVSKRT